MQPKVIRRRSNKHFQPEDFDDDLALLTESTYMEQAIPHESAKAFNDIVNDVVIKGAPKQWWGL